MKRIIALACFAWPLLTAAQIAPPPAQTDPLQAITRLREGLLDSFNRADIDHLVGFLDPDVVVTWQNAEVCEGTNAVKAYYNRMMAGDRPVVKKVTADPKINGRHIQGDWAVSWGDLNDTFELTDGSKLPFNSRFTATIARRGDRWAVTAFHVSANVFNNPVLALAARKIGIYAGIGGIVLGLLIGLVAAKLMRRRAPAQA
jgi:ketosteroid isomerase-like protein